MSNDGRVASAGTPHGGSDPAPLRIGVLGCGVIGGVHAEAIAGLADAELAAVADEDSERARILAERYGIPAYESLTRMLRESDVDVVNVCTPSGMHGKQTCEAMRSGRHVIVEKPIEITLPAIDRMLQVREESGVKLAVISQHRFDPASARVHDLVGDHALGRLVLGNASVLWWRSQSYYDRGGWRGTWAMDGGGVLMNQAIHSIDLLCWLMGPVESVLAQRGTLTHRIETEDTAVAALRFRNGALGTVSATTGAYPGTTTRIEILGDDGSAVIENDGLEFLYLRRDHPDGAGDYGLSPREARITAEGKDQDGGSPPVATHALQIADMLGAIREDRAPLVDGLAARHPVEVILAIYESARTGYPVTLPPTGNV